MKGITWSRDSHGLFDYESRHLTKKTMRTDQPVIILRSKNELTTQPYDQTKKMDEQLQTPANQTDDKPLLKIINEKQTTFYLESAAIDQDVANTTSAEEIPVMNNLHENMYLVVRSMKHNQDKIVSFSNLTPFQDYEIQERDILKIGRVKFAVKEIGYSSTSTNMHVDQKNEPEIEKGQAANSIYTNMKDEDFEEFVEVPSISEQESDDESEERKCRFCWRSKATVENPLLGSCKCSGSVGVIHLSCLCSWLEVKRQTKISTNFSSYYWKSFECEICKIPYPLMVKSAGKVFNLVKYDKPAGDYLVLESLSQEKNTSRIIHIIRPTAQKDVFKLGRGHESDLRINDISVSRCHAKIKLEKGKFMLEDNQSKFGTLVLVK